MVRALVLCSALLAAVPAHAGSEDYFARLAAAAKHSVDGVIAERGPTLVPPVPVKLTWKPVRLGSFDPGVPLVALTAADLDHDGKTELYAVTTREVIALGLGSRRVVELGRVPFAGDPAMPASRDPVGTAVVDGGELIASASAWESDLRVSWKAGALTARVGQAGALVCPGERLARVPGRNHFGDPLAPVYGIACAALVDPIGAPLKLRAVLTGTKLEITVERCGATGSCLPVAKHDLKDYGSVFAIADVDRDGKPEAIVSGAGAPGDPDAIKVITLGEDARKGMFRKTFQSGVVGIGVGDSDGDGVVEVVVATRLLGTTLVDLWRLD